MKWLRRTLFVILGLGALAGAAVAGVLWLLGTQGGAEWLSERLQSRAAGQLDIGRVEGSLLGGLVLHRMHVRLPRDEVEIDTLRVVWDASAALAGSLAFDTVRASPVRYKRLPAPDEPTEGGTFPALPFAIRIEDGDLESLTLETDEDTLSFGPTRFAARLTGGTLALDDVTTESGGVVLSGRGEVGLQTLHLVADLDWSALISDAPANGHFRLEGDWPVLTLHHELDAPFRSVADGELDVSGIPRVDLAVEWQDLVLPGVAGFASPSGRATISGAIDGYRFDSSGAVVVEGRAADFTAAGSGQAGLISLSSFVFSPHAATSSGELSAKGEVAIDTREWSLTVDARDVDPSWWVADWPGRVTGSVHVRGRLAPELSASAEDIDVHGRLRGYALAAKGDVSFDAPSVWQFDGVHVSSGPNSVDVDGRLGAGGEELNLDVSARIAQIGLLFPEAEGAVDAKVMLGGSWRAPRGRGRIEARAVKLGAYAAEHLVVDGQAGAAPDAALALTIDATHVERGFLTADAVHATLDGTTAAHRIGVTASAAEWDGSLTAAGGLTALTWRGELDSAQFDEHALGIWQLVEPARLEGGAAGLTLGTSCLEHAQGGRWCAGLKLAGRPDDQLVVAAQNFDLSSLAPLLPPTLRLNGSYALAASLSDLTGNPHGALAITGGDTHAAIALGGQQPFATELKDLRASATLDNGRLELKGSVQSDTDGHIEVGAAIDRLGQDDSPIKGNVDVHWPDLGWVVLLTPDIGRVAGTLDAGLSIDGTIASPRLQGRAAWNDGQVGVPAWGLVVEGIEATANTTDGSKLEYSATGHAGDGMLTLTGSTDLDPDTGWPTRLKLRGDSIRAVQLPDADILASPDLDIVAELPDLHVNGTVQVPHADVKLSELPAQAITPSGDAVVHGESESRVVRPLHLVGNILLTLGDDVHYSGLDLKTKVSGQLKLDVDSNRAANAMGTLTLDGTYNAYGQELNLERGQLIFSGPLDDPGLDVRAVRSIEDVRVGVDLVGTVQNPQTRIFSTPSMSEADALSYLLLGRPVSGTGEQETATLQSAALSMGLQQALPVVQRIGQSLGLDEFTVKATAADQGALMAGKYLSPKVYIRYSYGLFNRIGGLLLRFKVNERLSIETRSGEQKSMDLIYTVEKD